MATGPGRYRVILSNSARKQLAALPRDVQERIAPAITALADEPRPQGSQKLKGPSGEHRIRVGEYRIVDAINDDDLLVGVTRVGHRRDVYRP
jgi:mRNA interferase RelE/StbE